MTAYARCRPNGDTAAAGAIANQVRPHMNGVRLGHAVNGDNISCAEVIVETIKHQNLAQRAAVIAITTAITESTLHNYTEASDHDSLGLFQQRPSQGWGTPAQITNPVFATNAFLNMMHRKFPNNSWMKGDIGAICQRVQVSAVSNAYAREVHDAQLIVNALWVTKPTGSEGLDNVALSDKVALPASLTDQKFASVGDCLGWTLARSYMAEQSDKRQEENQKKILETQTQGNALLSEIRDLLKAQQRPAA
jgi:hypothetical protein